MLLFNPSFSDYLNYFPYEKRIDHCLPTCMSRAVRKTNRDPRPAGSTSDSPLDTSKNAFFGFDEQNGSLCVLRAWVGLVRPGLAREGPKDGWRRNTKVTAIAPDFYIRAGVPYRIAMVCTWFDRTFDIVWPMRWAPIVPLTGRANRWSNVLQLINIIIIFAR